MFTFQKGLSERSFLLDTNMGTGLWVRRRCPVSQEGFFPFRKLHLVSFRRGIEFGFSFHIPKSLVLAGSNPESATRVSRETSLRLLSLPIPVNVIIVGFSGANVRHVDVGIGPRTPVTDEANSGIRPFSYDKQLKRRNELIGPFA